MVPQAFSDAVRLRHLEPEGDRRRKNASKGEGESCTINWNTQHCMLLGTGCGILGIDSNVGGFPDGSAVKNSPAVATGDTGSIPGSGRSPGGGHGNRLQYPCLENPVHREVWWAKVHRVAKSRTRLKRVG